MFKIRFTKVLNLLIELVYLGVIFLVPLYFSIIPRTSNVFELNKIVLLRIFVFILFLLIFLDIIFQKKGIIKFFNFFKENKRYFFIPVLYFLSVILSAINSVVPKNSFWGTYDFQLGLYTYFYIFIFFFSLIFTVKSEAQKRRVILSMLLSSAIVCAYGLLQILNLDPLNWTEASNHRIFSTLGQPNFLSSYLLLIFPLSVYVFFQYRNKLIKFFALLSGLLHLFCLYFTYSRAGQLGFIAGVFIFTLLFIYINKNKNVPQVWRDARLRIYILVFLLILFSGALGMFIKHKQRLTDITNLQTGSVASRIEYYRAGFEAFKGKPFLGYGLANQKEIYALYYQKNWAIDNNVNSLPAQAHNIFLDCLLQGGIMGLIFWLMINAYFLYLLIKNINEKRDAALSWALLLAWLCYSFSLLFSFTILVTELYFWIFLALLIAPHAFNKKENKEYYSWNGDKKYIITNLLLSFLLIIFVGYRLNRELKVVIADHYFYQLESSLSQGRHYEAFIFYDWVKDININMTEYSQQVGNYFSQVINKNEKTLWSEGAKKILFPRLLQFIKDDSYESVCARAKIYATMSLDEKKDYHSEAEKEFEKCLQKGPNIPENNREFGKYFYGKGDHEKAFYYLKKSQELLPPLDSKGLNEGHRLKIEQELYLIDIIYGDIYYDENNFLQAEEYYRQAVAMNPNSVSRKKVADVLYAQHDLEGAINMIKENKNENQTYYFWSYLLAQLYKEKGEWVSAKAYAEEALILQEKNESVEKLLGEINKHISDN